MKKTTIFTVIFSSAFLFFNTPGCVSKKKLSFRETSHRFEADIQARKSRISNQAISDIDFDVFTHLPGSPKDIAIAIEPTEGGDLVYHRTPGFTSLEPALAQLSVLALVQNQGMETVDLDRVRIEYQKGNQTIAQDVHLPDDQLIVDPNYSWYWQNSRPYHQPGDVVFLESPFPNEVTIRFYFKDYRLPVTVTKRLKPYPQPFALPFVSGDLAEAEYWTSYSMHGGGAQVFAYDLGVNAYVDGGWTHLLPDQNGAENDHFRVWGKPIYAMADGKVLHFLNEVPNNDAPIYANSDADFKEKMDQQKQDSWGPFENDYGGAGNHLYIKHGDVVALYAHLQRNSLPRKLMTQGATVKKGDLLGLAGNSGNSTAPHLHIHIKTYVKDNEPEAGIFRPLQFDNGYVIGRQEYPSPQSNINWSLLNNQGIPGLQGRDCFISPSKHPYCAYPTNWGEVSKHQIPEDKYQEEFNQIYTCGYYPIWVDGFDVNGQTYFNVIFRNGGGEKQWVARHHLSGSDYQTAYDTWKDAGYRLINVDSYLFKGQVRYAAVWVRESGPQIMAYHGRTLEWHEERFERNMRAGWTPVNVSLVQTGGQIYVTALWEKKNVGGFYLRPVMSLGEYKDYFEEYTEEQGFKLVYLNGYTVDGQPRLSGIWHRNAPDYNTWWAKHHLTASEYQAEYTHHLDNGYLTRCITGYADGGTARFEGVWSK